MNKEEVRPGLPCLPPRSPGLPGPPSPPGLLDSPGILDSPRLPPRPQGFLGSPNVLDLPNNPGFQGYLGPPSILGSPRPPSFLDTQGCQSFLRPQGLIGSSSQPAFFAPPGFIGSLSVPDLPNNPGFRGSVGRPTFIGSVGRPTFISSQGRLSSSSHPAFLDPFAVPLGPPDPLSFPSLPEDPVLRYRGPPNPRILNATRYHNIRRNDEREDRCPLAHPTFPHILPSRSGEDTISSCFSCGSEQKNIIKSHVGLHYYCTICNVEFHHGCHKFPRKVTHPYHLQHPLTLTFRNHETGIISDGSMDKSFCREVLLYSSTSESNTSDPRESGSINVSPSQSDIMYDKCTWCGKNIEGSWFYRCCICNFRLDLSCSQNIPLLIIANPRSHHHSLVFYPRPLLTQCDACGLVNVLEPSYACFQCNYMVHGSCITLPRVIKITRHRHRIYFVPYFQSTSSRCRICYKTVDIKYGQYSCNYEDCSYVVHSKCATHENIWEGRELEWEPEEPDETEFIIPFKKVGKDMIIHFSHDHFLKLEKYDGIRDAEKQCQVCCLPINSHDFYNCTICDYFLHEVCAGLPRKVYHALHVHPLFLDPFPPQQIRHIRTCTVCFRKFTGFVYRCFDVYCSFHNSVAIDVCCILVPDYVIHKGHEHPLFVSTSYDGKSTICCKVCKEICGKSYLQCTECIFVMCYRCATIPDEVSYKYDKHPISLCYGEEVDGMYWCEVCEKEVNPTDWFYTCNECCVTIHLHCVFGSSVYIKPGFQFEGRKTDVEVIRNSSCTRPICYVCDHRCTDYIYYQSSGLWKKDNLCSLDCVQRH